MNCVYFFLVFVKFYNNVLGCFDFFDLSILIKVLVYFENVYFFENFCFFRLILLLYFLFDFRNVFFV